MTGAPITVVGDCLLDRDLAGDAARLAPDSPVAVVDEPAETVRPGGAGLAAALAAADGRPVRLVTALAADGPARTLRMLLERAGVEVVDLGAEGRTCEKVRVRARGQTLLRLDYGVEPGGIGPITGEARAALADAAGVLVADYGRGVTADADLRALLADSARRRPLVWDPHPRGAQPVVGAWLVTPSASEAVTFTGQASTGEAGTGEAGTGQSGTGQAGDGLSAHATRASILVRRWGARAVVITLGSRGALLVGANGTPLAAPARPVDGADTCGAGDRFASAVAGLLADGALTSEAVVAAVSAASRFVATGGADGFATGRSADASGSVTVPAALTVDEVRSRGGVVVATGGCFDLLHRGHVRMLEAARALGDCLVVCLNDDASVRRLKGPGRPVMGVADRAAVLGSLSCVDAIEVFAEDTPERVLARLRPDIWAKGGDYTVSDLPEARLLDRWGGKAVVLPYMRGRSTTRLIEQLSHEQPRHQHLRHQEPGGNS